MRRKSLQVLLTLFVVISLTQMAWAKMAPYDPNRDRGPVRPYVADVQTENRVHDQGKMWMNITNYGYFGNEGPGQDGTLRNPCPPRNWAPQCEFPGGSGQQYLYRAALWVGSLIVEEGYETKRVSVGFDGWFDVKEMYPGASSSDGIRERSTRPGYSNCLGVLVSDSSAVSDQDFIATYSDTLKDPFWVAPDNDGTLHRPLGVKITQTTYSFTQAFAEDFILIDYEFENIAANFLKNLYIGLYVDSDVGPGYENLHHTDDICGFRQFASERMPDGRVMQVPIDIAYIADNDGRSPGVISGPFNCPHVSGTRVIRGPNPRLETSFNWWISNGDVSLDYGPSWQSHCAGSDTTMRWTKLYGTPVGDEQKYQVLSDGEFDFDQVMVDRVTEVPPQVVTDPITRQTHTEDWCNEDPSPNAPDIQNGYDTRYLISWGPLGVRDYQDQSGRWIYRLNPGEKFNMTLAYVAGENFHDINHPQPTDQVIDSSLFNFSDLELNARWAKDVYDNRMIDTPQYDWGNDGVANTNDTDGSEGDGILETGDGWYGEDVGLDGLYGVIPPGDDSVEVVYFRGSANEIHAGWYKGPDTGENNSLIDSGLVNPVLNALGIFSEDQIIPSNLYYSHAKYGYWDMGWMSANSKLDQGDGIPDFTGPPPPPIPALLHCVPNTQNASANFGGTVRFAAAGDCYIGGIGFELTDDEVILRWSKKSSENPNYVDPFSRVQDFEGYRIHYADANQDDAYNLLAEFDRIDFAYKSANDSVMTYPVTDTTGMPQTHFINNGALADTGVFGYLKPIGNNTGFAGGHGADNVIMNDSTYEYHIKAHKLAPRYYAITAFDYGDQRSGLASQSTRPTANATLLAPAGKAHKPVRVVPNPYRAYDDSYNSRTYQGGIKWENQNDGTVEFYPQQDRRIEFMNLPDKCLIRIYTVAGDLVQIIPHNVIGDKSHWTSQASEAWDLNSRNNQQVVSGIYLFSVEDLSEGASHGIETGKFVIIR